MKVTINLLPSNKKETIRIQQLAGRVLEIGFLAITAVMVFSLFLLACLFIINLQGEIIEKESIELKKVMVYNEVQKTHEAVNEYYQSTQQLDNGLSDQVSYINLLEKINDLIPDDLFLQEISIAEDKLVINGFSSNRNALIEFRDRLETEESFGSVESPISNFTASENVNFIFTIDINK